MDSEKRKQNFGEKDSAFPRLWSFGEISNSARRKLKIKKFKYKYMVPRSYLTIFVFVVGMHPEASASGISARATSA